MAERPVELCKQIATQRAELGRLRRLLPKPGPQQTPGQARCAYWLERAAGACQQAENAWDAPDA